MAAVRVAAMFRVRHKLGQPLLSRFLRGIGDIAEARRHISREHACRNHGRDLWPPGPVCRQHDQGQRTQRRGGADLVETGVRVVPFKCRVRDQTFPYLALHQLSLYRPLFRRLRISKPFGEGVDENETRYVVGKSTRIKPDYQTPIRMADKYTGLRLTSGL